MATKEKDIGKWFENQCKPHFVSFGSKVGRMFYSFPDSFASRGLVPPQPGEYMLLFPKGAALIELKASAKFTSFRSCMSSMVRDSQYGWHKKWHLSGNPSVFVFYSSEGNHVEVWDGTTVVRARSEGTSLPKDGYLTRMFIGAKFMTISEMMHHLSERLEYSINEDTKLCNAYF